MGGRAELPSDKLSHNYSRFHFPIFERNLRRCRSVMSIFRRRQMCYDRLVLYKLMVVPGCALVEFAAKITGHPIAWQIPEPRNGSPSCSRCLIPSGSVFSLLLLIQSLPTQRIEPQTKSCTINHGTNGKLTVNNKLHGYLTSTLPGQTEPHYQHLLWPCCSRLKHHHDMARPSHVEVLA